MKLNLYSDDVESPGSSLTLSSLLSSTWLAYSLEKILLRYMKWNTLYKIIQSGLNSYVRTGLTLIFWFTTITVSTTRSFRIDTLREDEARLTFTYILLYVVRYHVRIPTSWTVYTVADLYSVCIRPTIALESCTYKIMFVNSLIQGSNPKKMKIWNELQFMQN